MWEKVNNTTPQKIFPVRGWYGEGHGGRNQEGGKGCTEVKSSKQIKGNVISKNTEMAQEKRDLKRDWRS